MDFNFSLRQAGRAFMKLVPELNEVGVHVNNVLKVHFS